jgi:hypothetical protein
MKDFESMLAILLIFGGPVFVIFFVCLFRFLKARMRHKEILAAIEKGVALPEPPPSKPRIPRWITSVAIGIAFIVFSPAFVLVGMGVGSHADTARITVICGTAMPSLICLSIGLFFFIRGILLRKYEKQAQLPKASQ